MREIKGEGGNKQQPHHPSPLTPSLLPRSRSSLYDYSALHTLNVVAGQYQALNKKMVIKHLDERSYKV